jgi:hypothetical protein
MGYFLHGVLWALPVAPLAIIIGASIGYLHYLKKRKRK